ncbi:histidine kinase [Flexistipes sinusarabici DSM 4947]|uniref:histidine kinase n=1 Tax=Flexistipes sinusarabici (strain ATCC 49648 / DSM 4947 / MAS 10) TaxID=717231 RepID=F8E771_FLESM|nr:histidine kinase [Flexistipes sinusarabici DSM 4947]
MELPRLIENIFELRLSYLSITYDQFKVFEYSGKTAPNQSVILEDGNFHSRMDFYKDQDISHNDKKNIKDLILAFQRGSSLDCLSEMFNCTELLYSVLKHDPIDKIIYNMIEGLLKPGNFQKAGVFFLNESLMKLKGAMYGSKSDEISVDNFNFRRISIPLYKRDHFTDVIFFEKIDTVNVDIFESRRLLEYFDGDVACCGIYSSRGPVGAILAQSDNYNSHRMTHLTLYGKICSVALELSKTLKRLEFAVQDIDYFKNNLYASDNFAQIGRLVATVAHELKNPLVAIGGFSKRLERIVEEPKAQTYLGIIYSEVERLEKIVSDILSYSREMDLNKERHSLPDIIFELTQLLDHQLRLNGVEVKVEIPDDMKIYVDAKRMKQVLLNLFNNSLDAMQEGGILKIKAYEDGSAGIVEISDTGGGIPDEIMKRVYEPFYTTKDKGTGLGLPLCKRIIFSHGGDIKLLNRDGGVHVTIKLPN